VKLFVKYKHSLRFRLLKSQCDFYEKKPKFLGTKPLTRYLKGIFRKRERNIKHSKMMRDFRLPLRSRWEQRSFGLFRNR